jgi:hypothetical protein
MKTNEELLELYAIAYKERKAAILANYMSDTIVYHAKGSNWGTRTMSGEYFISFLQGLFNMQNQYIPIVNESIALVFNLENDATNICINFAQDTPTVLINIKSENGLYKYIKIDNTQNTDFILIKEILAKSMEPIIQQAINYATEKHAWQKRKGTEIPYITHPLKVMEILEKNGCSNNVIIAGVLHDTLEDTNAKPEEIEELFGSDVLAIVRSETEDKTKSWKERKSHTIEHLKSASLEVKLVCCADKLANLRDMSLDFSKIGNKLWERFNAPNGKADIAWYYTEVKKTLDGLKNFGMYSEYCRLLKTLFIGAPALH